MPPYALLQTSFCNFKRFFFFFLQLTGYTFFLLYKLFIGNHAPYSINFSSSSFFLHSTAIKMELLIPSLGNNNARL